MNFIFEIVFIDFIIVNKNYYSIIIIITRIIVLKIKPIFSNSFDINIRNHVQSLLRRIVENSCHKFLNLVMVLKCYQNQKDHQWDENIVTKRIVMININYFFFMIDINDGNVNNVTVKVLTKIHVWNNHCIVALIMILHSIN